MEVLPLDPVTPRRAAWPRSGRFAMGTRELAEGHVVSATSITATDCVSGRRGARPRSTSSPAAPAETALCAELVSVPLVAAHRNEQCPGESPLGYRWSPPKTVGTAAHQATGRGGKDAIERQLDTEATVEPPLRQALGCWPAGTSGAGLQTGEERPQRLFAIVEALPLAADDLIVLVALAGDQHDVFGPGRSDGRGDGGAPIRLDEVAELWRWSVPSAPRDRGCVRPRASLRLSRPRSCG